MNSVNDVQYSYIFEDILLSVQYTYMFYDILLGILCSTVFCYLLCRVEHKPP